MSNILAININFQENQDTVAGVLFTRWNSGRAESVLSVKVENTESFIGGEIFGRELKVVNALLSQCKSKLDYIVLDGLVFSDGHSEAGLGKYIYDQLEEKVVVIGVSNKLVKGLPEECGLCRGDSGTPLYVTAVSVGLSQAKELITSMHGKFRMPTLLKLAEKKSRGK